MLTHKMIAQAAPSLGATIDFSGEWQNQLGSIMDLSMSGQSLSGRYKSPVSGDGTSVGGDLVGWVDGDLISFTVNWTTPASLTAWTGQLVDESGRETIKTLWHLVKNIADADEENGLWTSTLTGTDSFWRI